MRFKDLTKITEDKTMDDKLIFKPTLPQPSERKYLFRGTFEQWKEYYKNNKNKNWT